MAIPVSPDGHAVVLRVGRILLMQGRGHERQKLRKRVQVDGPRYPVGGAVRRQRVFHRAQTHFFRVIFRQVELAEVFERRGPASILLPHARRAAALHRMLLPGARGRGKCTVFERLSVIRHTHGPEADQYPVQTRGDV